MANNNSKEGMFIDVQPLKTKKEIHDMIEALGMTKNGKRDQLLFKLGISTGLRCGDLVGLKVEQVRGKTSFNVREGKTSKERTVHLDKVMVEIAEYLETLPTETVYLFPSRKGDCHITTTQAYRILAKAGDMVGRNDVGTHTMRKTFGYQFYTQTKNLEQLMTILNHSSQKITLRYIGITKETIETSIKSVTFF